jgi:hypothetical protein
MTESLRNLRHALRSIRKHPGTAAVVVATIALAIGANTAIFSIADAVLFETLPVPDSDRLVRIYSTSEKDGSAPGSLGTYLPSSFPNYEDLRDRNDTLQGLAAFAFVETAFSHGEEAERIFATTVTPNYFDVLGLEAVIGRTFVGDEDDPGAHPVAVLSHGMWRSRFGADPEAVGRTVSLNGRAYEVIGVAPPFTGSTAWRT